MNPTAFVSYSHDSSEHADRVLALANRLRSEGIDVSLDQYEDSPAEGWPRWMDKKIEHCDFTLCICTATYYKRITGLEESGTGLGVKWEGNQIYQHLYDNGSLNERFIPVLYDDSSPAQIPKPLKGATFYYADNEDDYSNLYNRLRGFKKALKPNLGDLRPLREKERKTDVGMFVTGFIDFEKWDKAVWGGMAYFMDMTGHEPPVLGLQFQNRSAAEEIFKSWRERLGDIDEFNELRISIVEGDIPGEENGYSIVISTNVENVYKRAETRGIDLPKSLVMTTCRMHRMNPKPESNYLEVFKEHYKRFGSYFLVPVVMKGEDMVRGMGLKLHKREINLRQVSEITTKHDLDAMVFPKNRRNPE